MNRMQLYGPRYCLLFLSRSRTLSHLAHTLSHTQRSLPHTFSPSSPLTSLSFSPSLCFQALSELCQERSTASYINAQNGQELLLFNPFRELLEHEVTQAPIRTLRHLLSNKRLNAIANGLELLQIASRSNHLPRMFGVLCDPVSSRL
jgi:hypothetical protein